MQYGHFDDAAREYVITEPQTPSPWINYLGSEAFFTLMSNTSGGYSFYKDARMLRLTRYRYNNVPTDAGGQYFYINDGGVVWTPGFMPVKTPLDRYECRHGLGYTRITGEKNGLGAVETAMVPRGVNALVTKVELTNRSDAAKEVSLFSFVEFCLWNAQDDATNFQRNFSTGEVEIEGSAIYHKTEYRERRNHFAVYAVNAPVDGFDTDRECFLGAYNGFGEPRAVFENRSGNSVASGWAPVGSHHLRVALKPGERASFIFVLGYCENPEAEKFSAPNVVNKAPAYTLLKAFESEAQFDAAFDALAKYWDELLSIYRVDSGEARLNRMVNLWNQYQCMVTFNMSRSASYYESGIGRGMGFRDSTQDLLGFVHLIPARARERILDIAATQFPDGSAYHQYQPLTKRGNFDVGSGFNDDPLWLIFGVAESLFIAGMFVGVCPDYAELCRRFGWNEEAEAVAGHKAAMEKAVLEHGWDGAWFLRAYDAFGHKVGSHECDEGQIYIEPQGFLVMAGVGVKEGLAQRALDSVREKLLSEHGVAILTPPYTRYHVELGEISSYPPGYKENGGIFCHNNPWIALAEAALGHGGRAYDVYRRTCPAYIEDQKLHHTEPYVYSQMVAGPYAPRFGEAKNSWLTGTAAWSFYTASQGILGVKPDYDGLRIDPCLPKELGELTVTRKFRGSEYEVHILNQAGDEKGEIQLTVDGKPIDGCVIPADAAPCRHRVEAVIR